MPAFQPCIRLRIGQGRRERQYHPIFRKTERGWSESNGNSQLNNPMFTPSFCFLVIWYFYWDCSLSETKNELTILILQQVDTSRLGLSPQDALNSPYIASMGVYVFKKDVLLKLLKWKYPTSNDFGSEIIPSAIREHNVQVRGIPINKYIYIYVLIHFRRSNEKICVVLQAYFFGDYWEDIGTIKSFYDANLALTKEVGARNCWCSCSV